MSCSVVDCKITGHEVMNLSKSVIILLLTCTDTPPATSPQSPPAVFLAQRSSQIIKEKFAILVTKSHRKLENRKIKVDDVQTFLVTRYSSPNSKDGSDTVTTAVESARNLSEIFRALIRYGLWSYLNYYLLQDMIQEFAHDDDELNGMMEQYQQDLTGHILTLRIQSYLDATHYEHPLATSDSETSDDESVLFLPTQQKHKLYKALSVMIDANVTDHTIRYVQDLWQSLSKEFALPSVRMILHDILSGGIIPMETEPQSQTVALKRKVCCLQMCESVGEE